MACMVCPTPPTLHQLWLSSALQGRWDVACCAVQEALPGPSEAPSLMTREATSAGMWPREPSAQGSSSRQRWEPWEQLVTSPGQVSAPGALPPQPFLGSPERFHRWETDARRCKIAAFATSTATMAPSAVSWVIVTLRMLWPCGPLTQGRARDRPTGLGVQHSATGPESRRRAVST